MQEVMLDFEWLLDWKQPRLKKKKEQRNKTTHQTKPPTKHIKKLQRYHLGWSWLEINQINHSSEKRLILSLKSHLSEFWSAQSLRSHLKWSRRVHQHSCSGAKKQGVLRFPELFSGPRCSVSKRGILTAQNIHGWRAKRQSTSSEIQVGVTITGYPWVYQLVNLDNRFPFW